MYINSSFPGQRNLFEILEQDIQNLGHQFARWKMITSQLPYPPALPSQQNMVEINLKLDSINQMIVEFIRSFQGQLLAANQKLAFLLNRNHIPNVRGQCRPKVEQQKFQVVNEKINMLQESLKRTQESEKKLVETLNYMMNKYQDMQKQSKMRNEDYSTNAFANSEGNSSSFLSFAGCGGAKMSKTQNTRSRQKIIYNYGKRQDPNSINLINEASFNLDYSTQSNTFQYKPRENHFRMFSKQEPKLSLKPVGLKNSGQDDKISLGSREQDSIKSGKTLSMDKNEHRFRFLMDNLGQ